MARLAYREALPSVIEYLQSKGFILVTVSQLIGWNANHNS